jgi:UDP-N-acetylglucosamine 2-epimerase (non-hydrolysing)
MDKIALVFGTRPEIIKMSPIIRELQSRKIPFSIIHTGQHYDARMSDMFLEELQLPYADYNLEVGSGSQSQQTAKLLVGLEDILTQIKPKITLVQGDTNSTMAGALASVKLKIPCGHIEAGLRSYDMTMPEEVNRRIADNCSFLLFAPTEPTAFNLLNEGFTPELVHITGNTIVDAAQQNLKIAHQKSNFLDRLGLKEKDFILTTVHRAENTDDPERLLGILEAILLMENEIFLFPAHPRTIKKMKEYHILSSMKQADHVILTKPIGYLDFLSALQHAKYVLTDSGGVVEEAVTLNTPCLTLRQNTERQETLEAGANILVGTDKNDIMETINHLNHESATVLRMKNAKNPFGDGKASHEILNIIEGTADLQVNSADFLGEGMPNRTAMYVENSINFDKIETNGGLIVNMFDSNGVQQFPSNGEMVDAGSILIVESLEEIEQFNAN